MTYSRFIYGYLQGIIRHKACPVKVSIKVVESDKTKMVEHLRAGEEAAAQRLDAVKSDPTVNHSEPLATSDAAGATGGDEDQSTSSLPPLLHKYEPNTEGWIEFDKPVLYLYGGKGPLVGRDLLQFPMSLPDDGYVDIVIQERVCPIFDLCIASNTEIVTGQSQGDVEGYGRRGDRQNLLDGLSKHCSVQCVLLVLMALGSNITSKRLRTALNHTLITVYSPSTARDIRSSPTRSRSTRA